MGNIWRRSVRMRSDATAAHWSGEEKLGENGSWQPESEERREMRISLLHVCGGGGGRGEAAAVRAALAAVRSYRVCHAMLEQPNCIAAFNSIQGCSN